MEGSFVFKARVLNYSLEFFYRPRAHTHTALKTRLLCCSIFAERRSRATERRARVCGQYSPESSSFCCLHGSWIPSRRCWRSCGRTADAPPLQAGWGAQRSSSLTRTFCLDVLPAAVAIASCHLGFIVSSRQHRSHIVVLIPFLNASNVFFPFFYLSYTCLKHLNECAFVWTFECGYLELFDS